MKKLMKAYFAKLVISWKKNPKKTQKGQINFASFRLRWMRRKIRAEWMEVQVKILKKNFLRQNMKLVGVFSFSSRNDVSVEHEFPQEESSKLKRLKN